PKLAQFVHDYKRANPETDVRLISNSLGSEVLFSALSTLHSSGLDDVVSTATVLGGATNADAVCEGGRYAEGMGAADEVHNYWMEKDGTLNYLYRSVESEDAVGGTGSDGEPPDNYLDHEVRDVPDHYSYYRKSKGCVERFLSDVGAIS
ncbi:MAG: hypothetical protein SV760_07875, partial [Halobacteria archaeon]|nr:hypothetical protein [Halobacteria archaeon]